MRAKPWRVDGRGLQVVKAGTGLQVQIGVDRIGGQQAPTFQHPHGQDFQAVLLLQPDCNNGNWPNCRLD